MSTERLALCQQALLAVLAGGTDDASNFIANYAHNKGQKGILAYQSNAHALAERVLRAAYPVLVQMVGEQSFAHLARAFWHTHPPEQGDLGRWGHRLPGFVRASAQLADHPYLVDVAQGEWALHVAASAADLLPEPDSVALLLSHAPDRVQLLLATGLALIPSVWPVASLLQAHGAGVDVQGAREGTVEAAPSLAQAASLLRARQAETAVVWRRGYKPCLRSALPGEAGFLSLLAAGHNLGAALDHADALNFDHWLPLALHSGLLAAIRPYGDSE
ncbi:MAG: hypothetical protein RLZZ401_1258 [Pseudomonadota bacterium]|jgi:hypothetical protein